MGCSHSLFGTGKSELTLMRDRFEEALYLGEIDGGVAFASKYGLLIIYHMRNINRSVLADYLQTGYVSSAKCIFEGCADWAWNIR